jgi:hypothetical protein
MAPRAQAPHCSASGAGSGAARIEVSRATGSGSMDTPSRSHRGAGPSTRSEHRAESYLVKFNDSQK